MTSACVFCRIVLRESDADIVYEDDLVLAFKDLYPKAPMHLLIIFFIALLVFGPKKLPELGKGLGDGIRALKEGMKDRDSKAEAKPDVKPPVTPENNPENKA